MIERCTQSVDVTALTEYLAVQSDVIVAYLFGSRVTGRARAESDMDVAVLLNGTASVTKERPAASQRPK